MPKLSIIIPTHKRADLLKQCLEHLEQQTMVDDLEVIVVSDGHDDATASLMQNAEWKMQNKPQFLEITKSQQGVARNRGVQEAQSPICLFSQDDIFLQPDACKKHLAAHSQLSNLRQGYGRQAIINYQFAVLGFTTWDPDLEITPVMRWLEESGWQFGYPMIKQYAHDFIPQKIQHRFTYTSHISLPTHIALEHPFREDVTAYGWEDIEWGERLAAAGIKLYYEPEARAHHHHHITLEQSLKRMEQLGRSMQNFPDSDRYPPLWKQWLYKLMIRLKPQSMASQHREAFLEGLKQ